METLGQHKIAPIDIVVVNLYPFVKTAARPEIAFGALVEEIDIGGPSMVRSAAKNFQDVLVIVDPADYPHALAELERPGGPSLEFRFDLARKAFAHTAAYDAAIAGTLGEFSTADGELKRTIGPSVTPARLAFSLQKIKELRYGENPASTGRVVRRRPRIRSRGRAGAAGQGAVIHEPARPRFGVAYRPRVHRAGGGGDQAHQSMRRGDWRHDR
jgi:phosphoribosylaminoimidazolecarboxamide formyltransferase/IMP cyclohydrolase